MLIILYHQKDREFYSKYLLAYHAVLRGIPTIIAKRAWFSENPDKICPSVVIDCATSKKKVSLDRIESFKRHEHIVYSFTEEASIIYNAESFLKKDWCTDVVKKLDGYFMFGPWHYNIIKQQANTNNIRNMVLSGHPRFDIAHPTYKNLFESKIVNIKKKYNKKYLLLISSNVGGYAFSETGRNRFYSIEHESYSSREAFDAEVETQLTILRKHIEVADAISRSEVSDKIDIVVRPHPTCSTIELRKFIASVGSDLFIDNRFDILPWLHASDFILHDRSTSSCEGLSLDVLPFSLTGIHHDNHVGDEVSICADDVNQLASLVVLNLTSELFNKNLNRLKQIRSNYYSNVDEGSINPILDHLERGHSQLLYNNKDSLFRETNDPRSLKKIIRRSLSIARKLFSEVGWDSRQARHRTLDTSEVLEFNRSLNFVMQETIAVEQIGPEVYYLFSNQ